MTFFVIFASLFLFLADFHEIRPTAVETEGEDRNELQAELGWRGDDLHAPHYRPHQHQGGLQATQSSMKQCDILGCNHQRHSKRHVPSILINIDSSNVTCHPLNLEYLIRSLMNARKTYSYKESYAFILTETFLN